MNTEELLNSPKGTIVIDDYGVEWVKHSRQHDGKGCWWEPKLVLDCKDILPCTTKKLVNYRGPIKRVS